MYEYMKKTLIAALRVVSGAFAPRLPNVAEFPDRNRHHLSADVWASISQ
jgi:hypothetical protein